MTLSGKTLLRNVAPWLISVAALVFVFGRTDWQRLVAATGDANLPLFLAVTSADKLVFFIVWALVQAEAIRRFVTPVSRRSIVAIRGGSELFRAVNNPMADAAMLASVARLTGGRIDAVVVAAVVPFFTHLMVLLVQMSIALPFAPGGIAANRGIITTAVVAWSLLILFALLLRIAPQARIPGLHTMAIWIRHLSFRSIAPFFVWFAALAAFDVIIQGFASRAFGVPIPWSALIARIPVLYMALSLPSVGNFGVREFTWAGLFADFGDEDALVAYAFATNAVFLVWNVLLGVAFLRIALRLLLDVRRTREEGERVPEPILHDALDR